MPEQTPGCLAPDFAAEHNSGLHMKLNGACCTYREEGILILVIGESTSRSTNLP